jgi:hypothetical protein
LKELIDHFESTSIQIERTKVISPEEPSIIAWIESSFSKLDEQTDGPLSLNQRLSKILFEHPQKLKQTPIENDVPLRNYLNSSSDDEDQVELENTSEPSE